MFVTARIRQRDGVVEGTAYTPLKDHYRTPPLPRLSPAPPSIRFSGRHSPSVAEQAWFYRSEQEWTAMFERLKLTPCPHCKVVGMLIRHGFLRGYDQNSRKTIRARRVFCSNRHA